MKTADRYDSSLTGRIFRFFGRFDFPQFIVTALLLSVGLVFIHSTGQQIGSETAMTAYVKQLQWIGIGAVPFFFFAAVDYRKLWVPAIVLYLGCLLLLFAVLSIGITVYGAQRWLYLPGLGMRLQPSEMTKLAVIMVLSAVFSSRMFAIDDTGERGGRRQRSGQLLGLFVGALVIAAPFLLIVRQPDLGSALILPPIGGAIIFAAGIRWKSLAWLLGGALLVFTLAVANEVAGFHPLLKDYQKERILTFLDPERDLAHRGYNQFQAKLAVGSGGVFGKGIGQGTQNSLGFLPQSVSNNDFIFSVIAEETGFFGTLGLLALYTALLSTICRTALRAKDPFGRYLAIGTGTMFFTHVFINIGMSIGLAPVTGLPLPFVSYGGSFTITGLAALGMLQSVYRISKKEADR